MWKNIYVFIDFRKRVREGEGGREGDRENIDRLPPAHTWARYQTHNLGMCPGWKWNQRLLSAWGDAQSTEPHQPGLCGCFLKQQLLVEQGVGGQERVKQTFLPEDPKDFKSVQC